LIYLKEKDSGRGPARTAILASKSEATLISFIQPGLVSDTMPLLHHTNSFILSLLAN